MRAVTVDGGELAVVERPLPEPAAHEVLVRVHGAGLNRGDLAQRAGLYPAPPGVPPDIPGLEFAGVVERAGSAVASLRSGDRVFGLTGGGAQADYVSVPAAQCAPVPEGLDLVEAGGVPEAFVTVHDAMVTCAALEAGEWLLVHAVGSGVGTAGVQLGKALGARVVGTARTAEKLDRCRPFGLDAGIVPMTTPAGDLDVPALAAGLLDATGGVDVVLDLVGGRYVEADVIAATSKGRIVLIGALAGSDAQLSVLTTMAKRLTIAGTMLRPRNEAEKADAIAAFARDVVPLLATGTVAPVIEDVLPIADAAAAYDRLASNSTFGKLVLDCR
jgi:putative PIG3 family NAD(P)H quinone oxidoreductase